MSIGDYVSVGILPKPAQLTFTRQPFNKTVAKAGETVTLAVTAIGAVYYAWLCDLGDPDLDISDWTMVSEEDVFTFTVTPGMDGYRFRAVAVAEDDSYAFSTTATLTVTGLVEVTETDDIVTIENGPVTIKSLKVDINAVQSGSGDPSPDNIRPISGHTQANVVVTGFNILPPMVDGTYEGNGVKAVVKDGVATLSGTTTSSGNAFSIPLKQPITVPSGFYYHCGNSAANATLAPTIENSNNTAQNISLALTPANRITATPYTNRVGQTYNRIRFYIANGVTISGTYAPMFCFSPTPSSYKTYVEPTTHTVIFGETVYGGSLEVETGVLTVTHANIASYNGETINEPWISSMDVYEPGATPTAGAQVVYPLTEPQTVTLDPVTINTILGENNIYADCGDITVTYKDWPAEESDQDNLLGLSIQPLNPPDTLQPSVLDPDVIDMLDLQPLDTEPEAEIDADI